MPLRDECDNDTETPAIFCHSGSFTEPQRANDDSAKSAWYFSQLKQVLLAAEGPTDLLPVDHVVSTVLRDFSVTQEIQSSVSALEALPSSKAMGHSEDK